MSLSIVTFADLGKRRNLKTYDIAPVISVFSDKGELDQIICRRAKGATFLSTRQSVPTPLFYAGKLLERVTFRLFKSRRWEENLVDNYGALTLKKSDVVLCHPEFFPRVIEKAKKQGSIVVGFTTVPQPAFSRKVIQEEYERLGLEYPSALIKRTERNKRTVGGFDYVVSIADVVLRSYREEGLKDNQQYLAYTDPGKEFLAPVGRKQDDVFRVVYAASTSVRKGLHYLLEAWKGLEFKNAELVIVGDINVPDTLFRQYKAQFDADETIRWVGFTKNVRQYYDASSVFVLPSLAEGNPRVVMEAMGRGLPIITTENAQSIVTDGKDGFVLPIRDAKEIQDKIQYLYDNPKEREKMGKEARKSIENKKPFGEAVYEIYQDIMKRSNEK